MIKFNQTTSKITVVITAVFLISAMILIPSIGDKSYASPPHRDIKFIITVKHVFEAGSKIKVSYRGVSQTATVPGKSGTQHVTLDLSVLRSSLPPTFTICLSAPNHGQKCMQEHTTSFPVVHKTVDMNVLRH